MPDVICPHCGRSKAVTAETLASIAGKTIRCGCKAEFMVEERGPLDFLDSPAAQSPLQPIPPLMTKDERDDIANRNVADYKVRQSQGNEWTTAFRETALKLADVVIWIFVALIVIVAAVYSGRASSGGIGVLVFVASLIAILLTQVINLLLRIVALLEKD